MKRNYCKIIASALAVFLLLSLFGMTALAENATVTSPVDTESGFEWPNYRGSGDNIAVTSAKTARTAEEAELLWSLALKRFDEWSINISDPIMLGDRLYIAVGEELLIVGPDGKVAAKGALAGPIDYTCRPLSLDGLIILPVSGGRLQALTADTLETVWLTEALPAYEMEGSAYEHQTLTTLIAANGCVYYATACADYVTSYYGDIRCVDAATGELVWNYGNETAGYYWSGAAHYGGAVILAGDDGVLLSLDAADGTELDRMELGAPIRSTAVVSGNQLFFTSTNGVLHKIIMREDGRFDAAQNVQFAVSSTGTPAVYDGQVVVGGHQEDYSGVLAVIDAETMTVTSSVALPADVKSAPLIGTGHSGEAYAYFTSNIKPGGLYALKLGGSEAAMIFTPTGDDANFCVASILADENGTLYYTNDSGKLFAVAYKEQTVASEPSDPSSAPAESSSVISNPASAVNAGGPESKASQTGSYIPKTGESFVPFFLIAFCLTSLCVAVILLPKKKSREENQ